LSYNKKKVCCNKEGDDSFVVAFHAVARPKEKAKATLLLSRSMLQQKKRLVIAKPKQKATPMLLLSPFVLQPRKKKACYSATTEPK